jgi:hypothetical protein
MYEFVDRPLAHQPEGVRLLVWAMRRWGKAARDGGRVSGLITGAFNASRVPRASYPFTGGMRILSNNVVIPLHFGAIADPRVAEHEAVLLGALSAAVEGRTLECRAIARHLVCADMAPALAWSLIRVGEVFCEAEMYLAAAADDQPARPEPPIP